VWALLLLFWSLPASAQTLGLAQEDAVSPWRVVSVLLLGVALAVTAAFMLRKRVTGQDGAGGWLIRRPGTGSRRLRLVERLRIGQQVDLYIVVCDGQELLIATSAQTVQLLNKLGPLDREAAQ
jgi:flagellar biogenesis protein FliO